jgi:hypothetical protein
MATHLEELYSKVDEDRMFVYAWYETGDLHESKFGQKYVLAGKDPYIECDNRVRQSLGVRKDKKDEGKVILSMIWDVTDLAKEVDMMHNKAKVDDYIRKFIGYVKQSEVHSLNIEDLISKVNDYLKSRNLPRPEVKLSTAQYNDALAILRAMDSGKKRILAELCARYGKTIWSSALALESGIPLVVVTSYVLTSFTSFKNDVNKYNQFKEIELVDSSELDYKEKIDGFLNDGKQVMVFVSLCKGTFREERVDFLRSKDCRRLVFVDEADYGAHRDGQFGALNDLVGDDDVLVLMTGTNSDRASSDWDIDFLLSTTYFELLVNKKSA